MTVRDVRDRLAYLNQRVDQAAVALSAARERAKRRAAATMISGESPVMAEARSGGYASTISRTPSQPDVWSATKA